MELLGVLVLLVLGGHVAEHSECLEVGGHWHVVHGCDENIGPEYSPLRGIKWQEIGKD